MLRIIGEDVSDITSGIHNQAEAVAYQYADVERRHRFRFLFDPLRILHQETFIQSYLRGENPFPLSVEIDPSNACNHDCGYCIYHSLHMPGRREQLAADRLFELLDELQALGCRSVLFVGGGEPMTHKSTVDAIERAAEYGMNVGLVTNGSLITEAKGARLKRAATYVRFSLDAATRNTHTAQHRADDFEKIISNFTYLARAEGNCTVGTGFFANERNADEIYDSAYLVKDLGGHYIQIKTYSGISLSAELHRKVLEQVEKSLMLSDATFDVHVTDRIFENHTFQVRGYSTCHFQAMKTVINADGSVYLCAQKRTNPDGAIGNINEHSLATIWNSERRRDVVRNLQLVKCPYCVHDKQNKMLEFMSYFKRPHHNFY